MSRVGKQIRRSRTTTITKDTRPIRGAKSVREGLKGMAEENAALCNQPPTVKKRNGAGREEEGRRA